MSGEEAGLDRKNPSSDDDAHAVVFFVFTTLVVVFAGVALAPAKFESIATSGEAGPHDACRPSPATGALPGVEGMMGDMYRG